MKLSKYKKAIRFGLIIMALMFIDGVNASYDESDSDTFPFSLNAKAPAPSPAPCLTLPYFESFESGLGGFIQQTGDDANWTRNSGGTPSLRTGPTGASDGSYYIYIESSSPNSPDKVANLVSPCFDLSELSSGGKLEFMYHMTGSDITQVSDEVQNMSPDELQPIFGKTYVAGYFTAAYNVVNYELDPILGTDIETQQWQNAWNFLVDVVPNNEVLSYIKAYTVRSNSGTANMPVFDYDNPKLDEFKFNMGDSHAHIPYSSVEGTIMHEYGHLISMNKNICTLGHVAGNKYYFNVHKATATEGKMLYNFIEQFYTDEMWEMYSNPDIPNTLYEDYPSHFVTSYAATTPLEDFAETFEAFVRNPLPTSTSTVANQKIMFLENIPEISALRLYIRERTNQRNIGKLNVQVSTNDGASWNTIWTVSGDQGTNWHSASVDLSSYAGQSNVQFRFNGITGNSWNSDISIDNVSVTSSTVDPPVADFSASATTLYEGGIVSFTDLSTNEPSSWSWNFDGGTLANSTEKSPTVTYNTAGTYNVTLTATNGGGSSTETKTGYITVKEALSLPYSESFESGLGDTEQQSGDDLDWTRNSSTTPSSNTGPTAASDGSYYMFIESSSPNNPDKVANLLLPAFNFSGVSSSALDFEYHMFGSSMGTLNIQVSTNDGANWNTEWTKSGDQGNNWLSASVDLSSYINQSNVKIRFNAITGSGYTSDICIDNISLTSGTAVSVPVADFSADAVAIVEGGSVTFTDQSTNSPTSWSWTFDGGTPASSTVESPTVTYNTAGTYNVTLTATNAGGADTEIKTGYITVTEATCSYCNSSSGNAGEEWISNVTFNTLDNTENTTSGYEDFTSKSTNVVIGNTYTLSVSAGSTGNWTEHYWAFIDWNQDCDFNDAGESYDLGQASGANTRTLEITVPSGAVVGNTRMRISLEYNGDPTACEASFNYGQVEDYNLNVSNGELRSSVYKDTFKEHDFVVYPNPASSVVNIKAKSKILSAEIYTLDGIKKDYIHNKQSSNYMNIKLNRISRGIYILKVRTNDQKKEFRLIIK